MDGWIKVYRKLKDWEWYTDANVVHVFLHLLLSANFTDNRRRGEVYKNGQIVTSLLMLAAELDKSYQTILRCIKILTESGAIDTKSTNKKTIITIRNFAKYQQDKTPCYKNNLEQSLEQTLQQGLEQSLEQTLQPIYNKNIKKEKNVKKDNIVYAEKSAKQKTPAEPKKNYGEYQNVTLTDSEAQKLHEQFGDNAAGMVEYLSAYKIEKNYKTKSDYLTIKRWVADAYFKSLNQNINGNNGTSNRSIQERAARIAEYAFAANGL